MIGAAPGALHLLGLALACVLSLTACGHGDSVARPDRPPPQAKAATPRPSQHAGPAEPIENYMADHFVIVTYSRDAVINGELEALREPLQAFAEYRYDAVVPGGWTPWMAQIQQAARLTSSASTLDAASAGVAAMARACGGCHQANFGGLDFGSADSGGSRPPSETLDAWMERHMGAADRLWEGLVGPSDEMWREGTSVLARAPASVPIAEAPLPPRFVDAVLGMGALADDAASAGSLGERAEVYARLLAACAGCHTHGVDPAPRGRR